MLAPSALSDVSRLPMYWRVTAFVEGPAVTATAEVRVDGDVDSVSVTYLLDTLAALMRPALSLVVIDLSDSNFVGIGALRKLDEFIAKPSAPQPSIRIHGLSRTAQRVVEVAELGAIASAIRSEQFFSDSRLRERSSFGEIIVSWTEDGTVDASLVGEFDIANDAIVRAALDPVATGGATDVRLHTKDVTFAASSTLALMVWLHRRVTAQGGRFEIVDTSASVALAARGHWRVEGDPGRHGTEAERFVMSGVTPPT